MITEQEVINVLNMIAQGSPNSLIYRIVQAHYETTDAHLGFALQAALAAVSQTVPNNMVLGRTPATLYFLSVGPARQARKTTAWNSVQTLLEPNSDDVKGLSRSLMPVPGSYQVLFDELTVNPRRIMISTEGGDLFGATQEGYMRQLRYTMTSCFDGGWANRPTVAKNKAQEKKCSSDDRPALVPARLSCGCAIATEILAGAVTELDFRSGFLARFQVMFGTRERCYSHKGPIEAKLMALQRELAVLDNQFSHLGILMGLDASAVNTIVAMEQQITQYKSDYHFPPVLEATADGCACIAERIAMVLAWESGRARQPQFYLTAQEMVPACHIALMSLRSMIDLYPSLAITDDERAKRRILVLLEKANGAGVSKGMITRVLGLNRNRNLNETLLTLQGEWRIVQVPGPISGESYYRISTPTEAAWITQGSIPAPAPQSPAQAPAQAAPPAAPPAPAPAQEQEDEHNFCDIVDLSAFRAQQAEA